MKYSFFFLISLFFFACQSSDQNRTDKIAVAAAKKVAVKNEPITKNDGPQVFSTIAFGSCSNQNKKQEMWQFVLQNRPDMWIWLGDIIYGDSEDMSVLKKKYDKQKADPRYQILKDKCEIIGVWDDHDYGKNNACKSYPKRNESRDLLFDFLDIPENAGVRDQEGAYQSHTYGSPGQRIKVILLDGRFFRDELVRAKGSVIDYEPNVGGDMLGEAQWAWLEKELTNSDADIHLIGSGIQVIPAEHAFEKWANFPTARQRLFDLLSKTQPSTPILLSGDRHLAEISAIELDGFDSPIYEITSSGLTHSVPLSVGKKEPNQYRVGESIREKNFGMLRFDWSQTPVKINCEIRGLENQLFYSLDLITN